MVRMRCSGATTTFLFFTATVALLAVFIAAFRWRAVSLMLSERTEPATEFQRSLDAIAALREQLLTQQHGPQQQIVCPTYVPGEYVAAVASVMQLRLPQCADEVTVSPRISNMGLDFMQALEECLTNECCEEFRAGSSTRFRLLGKREWKPMITLGNDDQRFHLNIVSGPASCVAVAQHGSPWRGRVVEVHVVDRHFDIVSGFEGAMRVKLTDLDRGVVLDSVEANVDLGVGTAVLHWSPLVAGGGGDKPLVQWSLRVDILVAPSLRSKEFPRSLRRSTTFNLGVTEQASFCVGRQRNHYGALGNQAEVDPTARKQAAMVFLSLGADSTAALPLALGAGDAGPIVLRCGVEANEQPPRACQNSVLHDHAANMERIVQRLETHNRSQRGNVTVLFVNSGHAANHMELVGSSAGGSAVEHCTHRFCVRLSKRTAVNTTSAVWTLTRWNIPSDVDTFRMKEPWWQHIVGRAAVARWASERTSIVVAPECLDQATECMLEFAGTPDAVSMGLQSVVKTIRESFDVERTKCYTWETLIVVLATLFCEG